MEPENSKDFVTSFARGLHVICCFDKQNDRLTLSEVAKLADLSRATARRFLFTLRELGYVESDGKLFWLSPKILELGYTYLTTQPLVTIVQPIIEKVSKITGESCSVAALDDFFIVYIARHLTQRIMSVTLNVGTRLPAYATSMGRVLLAAKEPEYVNQLFKTHPLTHYTKQTVTNLEALQKILEQVRQQGFSLVSEELELGLRSIAVPIYNQRNQVVAAINVSSQAALATETDLKEHVLPHLLSAAAEIKNTLPY